MARIRKTESNKSSEKKWLFGKYVRLSKEDILTGESRSIISQDMILDNHLNNLLMHGEDVTVVDKYIDDGTSGMYDTRESFQRAIADIESGKINALIVCDLSRMFRNDGDQKTYLEYYFREKKIRIISCTLPQLDTFYEPNRVFNMDVKYHGMSNASMPIETSIKIKGRLAIRRKQGLFVGSFAPYGYQKSPENKHKLIVDEDSASVVKNIFKWFVYDNMSVRRIVEELNRLGIPNPSEYKRLNGLKYRNPSSGSNSTLWSEKTVRATLKSQYYIGNMEQHHSETVFTANKKIVIPLNDEEKAEDEIVENTHKAIVDTRTFELAQKLLLRDRRTAPMQKHSYLFSGLLVCGDCKKSMIAKKSKDIKYYYCSTYLKQSKTACTKHTIREDKLSVLVLKLLQLQIATLVSMKQQIEEINKSGRINNTSIQIEHLLQERNKELRNQQDILDSLYFDLKQELITQEQYPRLRTKVNDKIMHLKNVINELIAKKETLHSNINQNNKCLEAFLKHQNITELDRGILVELINKIYIYEDNKIEACFNYQDEYKLTLEFIKNNQLTRKK